MMNQKWILGLVATLVLTACGQQASHAPVASETASAENSASVVASEVASAPVQATAFVCENQLQVQTVHTTENELLLAANGQEVVLKIDVSGSGERYTSEKGLNGQASEWHQKGDDAMFVYTDEQGKVVETACKAN